jgi:hypothetical protein
LLLRSTITVVTAAAAAAVAATATAAISAAAAVATATATAATISTAAAAVAATAATVSTAAAAIATFTWFRFLNYNCVAVKLSIIQSVNCGLCFVIVWHFDEGKPSRFSSFLIHDNFRRINFSKSFECVSQVVALRPEIKFCNKNIHLKKIKG